MSGAIGDYATFGANEKCLITWSVELTDLPKKLIQRSKVRCSTRYRWLEANRSIVDIFSVTMHQMHSHLQQDELLRAMSLTVMHHLPSSMEKAKPLEYDNLINKNGLDPYLHCP